MTITPEQAETLRIVKSRVEYMRAGGARDEMIRAGLIAEGWPAAAVIKALEVETPAPMTPVKDRGMHE
jgi:hypothetical protein